MERELPGPVHRLPVVGGAPAGTVDVNQLRHVADGGSLDDVCHEGLVQHPDTCGHAGAGKHCGWVPGSQEMWGRGLGPGCGWGVCHRSLCPGVSGATLSPASHSGVIGDQEDAQNHPPHLLAPHPPLFLCSYWEAILYPLQRLLEFLNEASV